ncbi:piggyBac transposable element-derived protein 4-like [Conger conger]|uniref:piggyBac transposable element-derived protein 4-like n=1 Tax=Conger conger TaxID=82655 RepID=UPI002A5A6ABF|nr:piggyBac transposable element-derived protein 4-like [Conger conger]
MSEPAGDWHETAEPSTAAVGETAGPHPPERRVCRRVRSGKRPRLAGSVIRRRSPWPYRAASQPVGFWRSTARPDPPPLPKSFLPARPPGPQLRPTDPHSPLELFQMYFSRDAVDTLCRNTNKQAARNICPGGKYAWVDIDVAEFHKFMGLTFYTALVELGDIDSYWRRDHLFSVPFPATVMTRDRYRLISCSLQMSDPDEDVENDMKEGTADYDRLFRLKPLLEVLRAACLSLYHPRRNLSVHERMAATAAVQARPRVKQCTEATPVRRGFRLFVLADSSNGYAVDFFVYTGKSTFPSATSVGFGSVASLIAPAYLGTGYHLYVDDFYTSPRLFKHLYALGVAACGPYRGGEYPGARRNAMTRKHPRGTIRWIRDGSLLFVKWMDSQEFSFCSTIHAAFSGHTAQRRVRNPDSSWSTESIPCPAAIVDYDENMGGLDLFNQLIQYRTEHKKTARWYRTLFFHFMDIAATNGYLLHRELRQASALQPMTRREFQEELTAQLCRGTSESPPPQEVCMHMPVRISQQRDQSQKASSGCKTCIHCRESRHVYQLTPWQCNECQVPLCLIVDRNCFEEWHK